MMGSGKYFLIFSSLSRACSLSASLASMCRTVTERCMHPSFYLARFARPQRCLFRPLHSGKELLRSRGRGHARSRAAEAWVVLVRSRAPGAWELEDLLSFRAAQDAELLSIFGHGSPGDVDVLIAQELDDLLVRVGMA